MFSIRQDLLQMWYVDLVIDAMKEKYPLPILLRRMKLSRSSYYYQIKAFVAEDKYEYLRHEVVRIFLENKARYGYRRIHVELKKIGIKVSEKLVPRVMKEEGLEDRRCHYRWPGWIERMKINGYTRSMSQKGCSPDNAACEGLFGRIKNEFFYNQDWKDVTIEEFSHELDLYLHWYNEKRIKKSLGYLSPVEYRRSLGLVT